MHSMAIKTKMKDHKYFFFFILSITLHCCFFLSFGLQGPSKLYVVYLGLKHHEDPTVVKALHQEILVKVHESKEDALNSMTYSFRHGFSGFAAMLTESQAKTISELPEVKIVTPNYLIHGHTTRSWDFLGIKNSQPDGLLSKANYGDGVIIGVIDSGIWPESKSFNDTGYGPIPTRWKGKCQVGVQFNRTHCNRKIIGARFYSSSADEDSLKVDYLSPRDNAGHGTHTASTAAGSIVENASFNGLAAGTARGGAPKARLAIYKALWGTGGGSGGLADVLKAVDDAIHDGVDIISMSIGSKADYILPYAALHAVSKGISVVMSAGNEGPAPQTIRNDSPWILTVAASILDRSFPTIIVLGNNETLLAQSIYYGRKEKKFTELLVINDSCDEVGLNRTDIIGKVIVCSPASLFTSNPRVDIPTAVLYAKQAGVKGLIYAHYSSANILDFTVSGDIPLLIIEFELLDQINRYVDSINGTAKVKIEPTRSVVGSQIVAPRVAAFSSRGPSPSFSALLKPDIAAPGVSILAAEHNSYALRSGTSMSCPGVSGVVALLKSLHPHWSPAAIKSALMTTASQTDKYVVPIEAESIPRKLADPFDYGAGHIDPILAADPGLVYDIHPKDYFKFFSCGGLLTPSARCVGKDDQHLYKLNLPSIAIPSLKTTTSAYRTVTNVGNVNATYKAVIESPGGVETFVEPSSLSFDERVRVQTFKVVFVNKHQVQGDFNFGSLTWVDVDGKHKVRIPIAVRRVVLDHFADL